MNMHLQKEFFNQKKDFIEMLSIYNVKTGRDKYEKND